MSVLLVAALTVSGPVLPQCSWDRPGANSYRGDVVAAVDRYRDIPPEVRAALKKRMSTRRYDELVTITRDGIAGAYRYENLRDMHFGSGTVCRTVTRERWKPQAQERGLVYCEQEHCIIVPTVCRNVSRVTRMPMVQAATEPVGPPEPELTTAIPGELQFEPPAAGEERSFAAGLQSPAGSAIGLDGGDGSGGAGGFPLGGSSGGVFQIGPPLPTFAGDGLTGLPGVPPVPGIGPYTGAVPVPEPSVWLMGALAAGGLGWAWRRRPRQGPPPTPPSA